MSMMSSKRKYQLSCEILGHSADVRAVRVVATRSVKDKIVTQENRLLTASRDGTACIWRRDTRSNCEYILSKMITNHTGYVSSLCVIPEDGKREALVVTGGQDNSILVHSLQKDANEPLERYIGHKGLVTCMIFQHNQLISGSWDSTVRVWKANGICDVIDAHYPAVWAIDGLFGFDGTRRILSGGADHVVKLWEVDTKVCIQKYCGHIDVVRDVKIMSCEVFLSASNDCAIRKWNIHSGQCLQEIHGHEAFIYSLAPIPGGGDEDFVSCGEDGTIRVWKGCECQQVIQLPATSVWSVTCNPDGDIVSGSSDGVTRVFTMDEIKTASLQEISVFNAKIEEHKSSLKRSDINVSKLPGMSALNRPGQSNGDTLMINNNNVPEVYQWDSSVSEWKKIGNAIGKAPEELSVYNGKEYDFVFDIELDEGPPPKRTLKLPYNRSTDPYVAAEDFLSTNNLPAHYLDQVAEFIIQNTGSSTGQFSAVGADPFTGVSRYVPDSSGLSQGGNQPFDPFTGRDRYQPDTDSASTWEASLGGAADPFTGGGGYHPSEFNQGADNKPQFKVNFQEAKASTTVFFPLSNFKLFESSSDYSDKVMSKVREFNQVVDNSQKVPASQLTKLGDLCNILTAGSASQSPSTEDFVLVERLLSWPSQNLFPGLDIIRLALLNDFGHKYFIPDERMGLQFLERMMELAVHPESQIKNQLLVLRIFTNIFSRDAGVQLMDSIRAKLFNFLSTLYSSCTSRPYQIALATVVLNFSHYYSQAEKFEGYMECTEHVCKLLDSPFDDEAKFRALISIGSLALVSKDAVKLSAQPKDMISLVHRIATTCDASKVKQCAEAVIRTLK